MSKSPFRPVCHCGEYMDTHGLLTDPPHNPVEMEEMDQYTTWKQCAKCTGKANVAYIVVGPKPCDKGGDCEWIEEYGPIDGKPAKS